MKVRQRTFCVLCAAIFVCAPARAENRDIVVSIQGDRIEVTTYRADSLSVILGHICKELGAACEGVQEASKVVLPPTRAEGNWRALISSLLEGTGLNYTTTAPTHSSQAQVQILGFAPVAGKNPVIAGQQTGGRSSQAASLPQHRPSAGQMQGIGNPQQDSGMVAPTEEAYSAEVTVAGSQSSQPEAEPAERRFFGAPTDFPVGNTSPFPDSYGNPFVLGNSEKFFPFPDSQGNAITIAKQPSAYFPFPDSQGRPIPVSNQPTPYGPFPDSQGNPILIQSCGTQAH